MGSELLAIVYGLASAASWGAGDFSGGLATKRSNVYSVVILSQVVGGILLAILALTTMESIPPPENLILGATAGICGAFGLVALYSGLSKERMGVVAPVSAVVTAILPVMVSFFTEGLPSIWKMVGFGVALVAVWLLAGGGGAPIRTRSEGAAALPLDEEGAAALPFDEKGAASLDTRTDARSTSAMSAASMVKGRLSKRNRTRELGLPIVAGLGFSLFFVFMDQVREGAVLWPLVAARIASISVLTLLVLIRRRGKMPAQKQLPIIALTGVFDIGGNTFFTLATQAGRLDSSAVLSSLSPAGTVLLARLILKERLERQQWIGVAAVLVALALIAL